MWSSVCSWYLGENEYSEWISTALRGMCYPEHGGWSSAGPTR